MLLTLYTRPGCHLCDEMKVVLARCRQRQPFDISEVDISTDPALERRYGRDIPVLLVDGEEIARHRISDGELERTLVGRHT